MNALNVIRSLLLGLSGSFILLFSGHPTSHTTVTRIKNTQVVNASPTVSSWAFTTNQYDISVSNVFYPLPSPTPIVCPSNINAGDTQGMNCLAQKTSQRVELLKTDNKYNAISADLTIKNVSITPFVTGIWLGDCKANIDGINKDFSGSFSQTNLEKGILPNQSRMFHTSLSGSIDQGRSQYDSSGNLIHYSLSDIKSVSCKLVLNTSNGAKIEPQVVRF